MKTKQWSALQRATLTVLGAGLVACGGGGGGDDGQPLGTIALTSANRDTVARVTATGLVALGTSTAVPFSADGGAVALQTSAAGGGVAPAGRAAWLPPRVLAALLQQVAGGAPQPAPAGRAQRLAVVVNPPESCAISGSVTVTFDDRDDNGRLSVGDVWTFAFDQCKDNPSDIVDGTVVATFTRIDATLLPSFGARIGMTQLSQEATNGRHGVTINGNLTFDYAQTSGTTETLKVTAGNALTADVHTHLPFTDTVTLQQGFVQEFAYDAVAARSTATLSGSIGSQAAGGIVVVSTDSPIVSNDADPYPASGSVRIAGSQGVVRLTALSAEQVQIALDADGDGSFESSDTNTWDWLF